MNSGWIKINRCIMDMVGYYDEKFPRPMCWIDLLLLAEWRAERIFHVRGIELTLKRGQIAISIDSLSRRWRLSKTTVQKRLQEFIDDDMIVIERSNIVNIITVKNYEKYQNNEFSGGVIQNDDLNSTQNGTQNGTQNFNESYSDTDTCRQQSKNDGTQNGIQISMQNSTQNGTQNGTHYKNIKNINNIYNISSSLRSEDSSKKILDSPSDKIDFQKFVKFFNDELDEQNSVIPRLRNITGQRKNHIIARCREYGKESLAEMVRKAARSDFLNGKNDKGWIASFSWMILPNNFPKVIEGNYDNNNIKQAENGNNDKGNKNRRGGLKVEASGEEDYSTTF